MSVVERTKEMVLTKDVLDHHLKCFGEGDLKGILSDYAPGAVLFTPDGPLRGADAMRPLFQALIAEFGKLWPTRVYRCEVRSRRINEIGRFGACRARNQSQRHLSWRDCHFYLGSGFSGIACRPGRADPRNCET